MGSICQPISLQGLKSEMGSLISVLTFNNGWTHLCLTHEGSFLLFAWFIN
jgi:hypothetical protein